MIVVLRDETPERREVSKRLTLRERGEAAVSEDTQESSEVNDGSR